MFFFQKNIPNLSSDDSCPTLHAIPLLITADSKAHHEIGLTQGLSTLPAMWSLCGRKAALLLWWISKTLLDTLCSKFIVVAPFVLRELIPRKAYDSFCLLKDMYCLVYSKQLRIEGWHPEHHEYFKKLFWKHAILFEEVYGLSSCTENLEYSLHMPEDVKRHSLLDNYWCYLYERQVKYYKQQTSNMKCLCKSFADRANLLHFTSVLLSTHEMTTVNHESKFTCLSQQPLLLTASSMEQAIELKEFISNSSSEWCFA